VFAFPLYGSWALSKETILLVLKVRLVTGLPHVLLLYLPLFSLGERYGGFSVSTPFPHPFFLLLPPFLTKVLLRFLPLELPRIGPPWRQVYYFCPDLVTGFFLPVRYCCPNRFTLPHIPPLIVSRSGSYSCLYGLA